jgi:TolB-like protein/thioredoxin-like negative regulator of GroEL
MLSGTHPFGTGTVFSVVSAILYAEPPPLRSVNKKVTAELERLIHRMMMKDPALRHESLREVYFDLDAIQRNAPDLLKASTYREGREDSLHRPGRFRPPPPRNAGDSRSVAVITFVNITGQAEDDWLGPGIAETVTSDLKNINGLTVIGRERIYDALRRLQLGDYEALDEKVATRIGREIGARWMICGGYQRFGEMLRITARTIEVETGEVVKTVKVDGRMSEVFELQDKVVYQFLRDLDLNLLQNGRDRIARRETEVIAAYEAFSRGIPEMFAGSNTSVERAIECFEQALSIDSSYTIARVSLGYALALQAEYLRQPTLYERAVGHLREALAREPELTDGWVALALTLISMGQFEEATAAAQRACELGPDDQRAHLALGRALFIGKGEFEAAAEEFKRALAIDPESSWAALLLAHSSAYLRKFERGEAAARLAIKAQEGAVSSADGMRIIGAHTQLGQIYAMQKRDAEALSEFESELAWLETSDHALRDRERLEVLARMVGVCRRLGQVERAQAEYQSASIGFAARQAAGIDLPFTRYYIACAAAAMGEKDLAIEHLAKAIEARPAFMIARARVEPDFESLYHDLRFAKLLKDK